MRISPKHLLIYFCLIAIAAPACEPRNATLPSGETPEPVSVTETPNSGTKGMRIEVTSAADSGPGTLRQALLDAQSGDEITFDPVVFPPSNPETIKLTSMLPGISQGNLIIDASEAGVILDGSQLTAPETVGFAITSDSNTLRGMQIIGFTLAGVGLFSGAERNFIGGDRAVGAGPTGQGNRITSDGNFGIGLWHEGTSLNTIEGNLIGTDLSGTTSTGSLSQGIYGEGVSNTIVEYNVIGGYVDNGVGFCCVAFGNNSLYHNYIGTSPSGTDIAPGLSNGVAIEGSGYNTIGPGNVIADNGRTGIAISGGIAVRNRITANSIYNNGGTGDAYLALGIELLDGANKDLAAPVLLDFDLQAGTVSGLACPGCTVQVFSDDAEEGAIFEGETLVDATGTFELNRGAPFTGPHLTATARDSDRNTSQFSVPTANTLSRNVVIQTGNTMLRNPIQTLRSGELPDNYIGGGWELHHILGLGAKRSSFSINSIEWNTVDWSQPEFEIDPNLDAWVTTLADDGVQLTVTLSFWDKVNHPGGWDEPSGYSRFQDEEEVGLYLEFVEFVVQHFRDRVDYFELWNEPDNAGFPVQYIEVPYYIKLVEQVVPVIRQVHPEAKIVVGSVSNLQYNQAYLLDILRSGEIMPLVDVIAWHPFYGASPSYGYTPQYGDPSAYYFKYPSIVQEIKQTAEASGFRGEYYVDEMGWPTDAVAVPDQPWVYSDMIAAKYYARGVVMHLGMGINTEAGAMTAAYVSPYATVRNLCTVMAGANPGEADVVIKSEVDDLRKYIFKLPDGDILIALWSDGAAEEFDPGIPATVVVSGAGNQSVTGIDVVLGYEQPLKSQGQDGDLIVEDLLVKDYPILLYIGD